MLAAPADQTRFDNGLTLSSAATPQSDEAPQSDKASALGADKWRHAGGAGDVGSGG